MCDLVTGVVEISVGSSGNQPFIEFSNLTYQASLREDAGSGTRVLQVSVTTTGVSYTFVSGNENNAFTISRSQGQSKSSRFSSRSS